MAASSITCCANWRRKMKAATLALLIPAGLTLAACEAATPDKSKEAEPVSFDLPELATVEDLTVDQLVELQAQSDVRLIDVRRDDEVAEGIIPGAEHIVLDEFDPEQLDLSDGREVVLYCRSGRRSGLAAEKLAAFTGKPARHLEGGIIAWKEAEQPIATP